MPHFRTNNGGKCHQKKKIRLRMKNRFIDKRILSKELDFLRLEWRKLGQHYEKMCFQTFSPWWMQFSTV